MANLTIFEFFQTPNGAGVAPPFGEALWPADKVTATTTAAVVTLTEDTQLVVITADADCRMRINKPNDATAATANDLPVLSAVKNKLNINKRLGLTLRFV